MRQKLVLCIVDGFGIDDKDPLNPIPKHMPWWVKTWKDAKTKAQLKASGTSVGLPDGQMGNSEVGHLTIGSGQIIEQDLIRVGRAISGQFLTHPAIQNLIQKRTRMHLMGLFSDGGVHSHKDHYMAIFHHLKDHLPVLCHLITDGRDTKPSIFAQQYEPELDPYVATVMGRYYAMDRDKRWMRTQKAIDAMMHGQGYIMQDVLAYVDLQRNTDEFIEPGVKEGYAGFQPGDAVIVVNFRADRIVQLLSVMAETTCYQLFSLSDLPVSIAGVTTLFPKSPIQGTLGECIAGAHLRQLRVAETEKYAHVTYFFNGGRDEPWSLEDRILIPSPHVATYDEAPEMSAKEVTAAVLKGIDKNYDVIIVNYANADMVGHTGKYEAVIKALTCLDRELAKLYHACVEEGYALIITADHGNVENMFYPDMMPYTAHSTNPVPFVVLNTYEPVDVSMCTQLSDIAQVMKSIIGIN
jgi:2,3-bisphosphoglycerate-independent phosphoglycerate mutase